MPKPGDTLARWARDLHLGEAQTWRLISGLILLSFVLTHFLNHALGHISVETMEEVQLFRRAFWRSWPGPPRFTARSPCMSALRSGN